MLRLFKRDPAGGAAKPSLDALSFDTTGYRLKGEPQPGELRVWQTPEGDGLGVYFFPVAPDLPSNAESAGDLAGCYHRLVEGASGKVVEVRVVVAGEHRAVYTISSFPQQPSGPACACA